MFSFNFYSFFGSGSVGFSDYDDCEEWFCEEISENVRLLFARRTVSKSDLQSDFIFSRSRSVIACLFEVLFSAGNS